MLSSRRPGLDYRTSRRGVGALNGWRPTQLSGCVLWLRADMGITKDGSDRVSAWADQSGNGNNLAQGTGANQPLFVAADSNFQNQPTVRLNGTSNRLDNAALNLAQPFTVVACARSGTTAAAYRPLFDNISGTGDRYLMRRESVPADNFTCYAGAHLYNADTWPQQTKRRVAGVFNGASSTNRLNDTASTGNPGAGAGAGGVRLGGDSTPTFFWLGEVAEVAVYTRALSTAELNTIFAYFSGRYGA